MEVLYMQDVLEILKKSPFGNRARGNFHIWWISKNLSDRRDRTNKGLELWTYIAEHELLFVTARDQAKNVYQGQTANGLLALEKGSELS